MFSKAVFSVLACISFLFFSCAHLYTELSMKYGIAVQ